MANGPVHAVGGTRCQQEGPDLPVPEISMQREQTLEFLLIACRTNAAVKLSLDGQQQVPQPSPNGDTRFVLSNLSPGSHRLAWSVACNGETWQTRTDITVANTLRFRHRRDPQDGSPYHSAVLLEVV